MENFQFFQSLQTITLGSLSLAALLQAVIVLLLCLAVIRLALKLARRLLGKSRLEKGARSFVLSALRILLWVLAFIIVAQSLGIPTTPLVTLMGIVGLALSLSLQNLLENVFSGLTILATHPFKSGDYVQLGSEEGTVCEIGLFYTKITTMNNQVVYLPNGDVTASRITNFSAMPLRRMELKFSVGYVWAPEKVEQVLLDTAKSDERILPEPAAEAHLLAHKDGAAEYALRAWAKREDYWDLFYDLNKRILHAFAENGIEIAREYLNVRIDRD